MRTGFSALFRSFSSLARLLARQRLSIAVETKSRELIRAQAYDNAIGRGMSGERGESETRRRSRVPWRESARTKGRRKRQEVRGRKGRLVVRIRVHAPRRGRPRRGSRSALTYCSTFVRRAQQPFRTSWGSVKRRRWRRTRTKGSRGKTRVALVNGVEGAGDEPRNPERCPCILCRRRRRRCRRRRHRHRHRRYHP